MEDCEASLHTHTLLSIMHGYLINYYSLFLCRQVQDGMKSLYNTPVLWSVYILNLVLKWIEKEGGVEGMIAWAF